MSAAIDMTKPKQWPARLTQFAVEALRNEMLHKSRAKRLVDAGVAVMLGDRCILKLPARDALHNWMRG